MTAPSPPNRRLAMGLALGFLAAGWPAVVLRAQPVVARRVEGQLFPAEQDLAGAKVALVGAGVFSRFGIKAYAAALYLVAPAADVAAVVTAPGPKRIQIRMLRELPATEFSKALRKGVLRNSSPVQQQALQEALAALVVQIDGIVTARKGDIVDLDYDPAQGMSMRANGTLRGPVLSGTGGAELYAATLMSFVGERPYSPELRAALLGRKVP